MKVCSVCIFFLVLNFVCSFICLSLGTLFIPPTTDYTAEVITDLIIANFSPPAVPSVSENQLENAASRLLELYPDIPALGSPFNTGNDTFGLSPGYKRISALCKRTDSVLLSEATHVTTVNVKSETSASSPSEGYGYRQQVMWV